MLQKLRHTQPVIHLVLVVLGLLVLYPMIFMVVNALKTGTETGVNPFAFPLHPLWINFSQAFHAIAPAFKQSVFIVTVSVLGTLALATLSGYAFGVLQFPERDVLFYFIFGLLLIPGFLTLIPLFLEIKGMGLLNSPWGLILPYVAGGQAFNIFILRSYFRTLPSGLFEAAAIDGAGHVKIFTKISIPLLVPILITLALLQIVGLWSDFVLPSLILNSSTETLAVSITNFVAPSTSPSVNTFNLQLAAFTLSSIPIAILFLFLMRYFVRGITDGGIKM